MKEKIKKVKDYVKKNPKKIAAAGAAVAAGVLVGIGYLLGRKKNVQRDKGKDR